MSLVTRSEELQQASSETAEARIDLPYARRIRFEVDLDLVHAGRMRLGLSAEILGAPDAPAVVVLGGISAGQHLCANTLDASPGWWETQVGTGRTLDPARHQLIGIEWLGARGDLDVPLDTADQAQVVAKVLDFLGLPRAEALIGASYGAMVALKFAALFPTRIGHLLVISGAHRSHPFASAWRGLQRRIVRSGIAEPDRALALARQLAMLSYRTPEEFAERFAEAPTFVDDTLVTPADAYLEACGQRYVRQWTQTAFLRLNESIDAHRVDPAQIRVPTSILAIAEDRLVPIGDLYALAEGLGVTSKLHHLRSRFGHDAFLTEHVQVARVLREFLNDCQGSCP
ncbi:MAG: homoserine O-succinyltransferase [Ahniella sp.]|nr:homoserine O-succinyltransferase [Ahniella sp.]